MQVDPTFEERLLSVSMTPGNLAAYASDELQLDDTMNWLDENVPQIRVPSVIVGGEADHLVGIYHLRRLAATLPGTRLITVDGSHMIPYTHPDVIAEQVKSAMRR
jgi:pimeloyl-ACP methyl ester carboxylesterase